MVLQDRTKTATRRLVLIYVALPLAYVIAGRLGLMLAVSPGYATAVFLPAGIAVAAAFMMGATSLPGILLGSFVLNVWIGYSLGRDVDAINLATAAMTASMSFSIQGRRKIFRWRCTSLRPMPASTARFPTAAAISESLGHLQRTARPIS
jgi:integral membrane sensor domain MASE1